MFSEIRIENHHKVPVVDRDMHEECLQPDDEFEITRQLHAFGRHVIGVELRCGEGFDWGQIKNRITHIKKKHPNMRLFKYEKKTNSHYIMVFEMDISKRRQAFFDSISKKPLKIRDMFNHKAYQSFICDITSDTCKKAYEIATNLYLKCDTDTVSNGETQYIVARPIFTKFYGFIDRVYQNEASRCVQQKENPVEAHDSFLMGPPSVQYTFKGSKHRLAKISTNNLILPLFTAKKYLLDYYSQMIEYIEME